MAFELDVRALLGAATSAREFEPVPVYPSVELDVALVVDDVLPADELVLAARSAGGKLLAGVHIFDVFTSTEKLGEGKKSVALSLSYRSPERTLTLVEVEKLHGRVVRKLEHISGGTVRA
jgi:phenylalanyl-tRNA synthetase beta chain